jgi:plasmid stabilization system protein ParE
MIVEYTPEALSDLDVIWDWNAQKYGNVRADAYIEFLRRETDHLATEYAYGRTVPTVSTLRYRMIQKKKRRHGYVVIYEVDRTVLVRILRYFSHRPGLAEQARRRIVTARDIDQTETVTVGHFTLPPQAIRPGPSRFRRSLSLKPKRWVNFTVLDLPLPFWPHFLSINCSIRRASLDYQSSCASLLLFPDDINRFTSRIRRHAQARQRERVRRKKGGNSGARPRLSRFRRPNRGRGLFSNAAKSLTLRGRRRQPLPPLRT